MKTRCLLALVFCLPMFSQMTITGNISGSVLDQSGKAVPAAKITLISRTTNEIREASTNDSGTFNLVAVRAASTFLSMCVSRLTETKAERRRGEDSL